MTDEHLPEKIDAAPPAVQHPLSILQLAVERGIDPTSIEKLAELAWKQQDREAAQEFAEGLRAFQEECPPIRKSRTANIASRSGGGYSYSYAPLDEIDRIVKPILGRLGFSYSWSSTMDGALMRTTCTLRHANGHEQTADFACPADSPNPGISGAQKHAAAMTFARRQTLTAVLGLTTTDTDVDGADPTPITEEQAMEIENLLAEANADRWKFLRWVGSETVEEIPAGRYEEVVDKLKRKAAQR